MAAVAISDSNLRRQDMEGAVSGTTNIGSGAGVSTFAEAIYQGAQSWGRKIGATASERGFFLTITSIDMTAAGNEVVLFKGHLVNSAAIHSLGMRHCIGSSTSAYYQYIIHDDGTQGDSGEFEYPIRGGWVISPVDPNVSAWRDGGGTTPTLTAVVEVAITGAITITTVNQNIIFDAVDFGPGLWMVGGDGGDADGVFQDFVDDDEGAPTAGRFGHVQTLEGVIYVLGTLTVGADSTPSTTATVMTDSLQTVVFPGGRVDAGWNGFAYDLGNATTAITLTNNSYVGRGRDDRKVWFDSESEVTGGATDSITVTGHGFATGDAVLYADEGGTAVGGLTDLTEYFVIRDDADTIGLTLARPEAFAGTPRINLTPAGAGTGEQHSLRRQPDTRPDLNATGTSGSYDETGSVFQRFRQINLTSACTLLSCTLVNCRSLSLNQGALDSCVVTGATLAEGEAFVSTPDLSDITDCTFEIGDDGHAIEVTVAGTYTFTGNTFTGYWTHSGDAGDGAEFGTTSGVDGATEVVTTNDAHGLTTGDAVYYNDGGGAIGVGLTDGARYYVNVLTTTTLSLHVTKQDATSDTNRVDLTASGAETHALYSSKAAILNNSGGLVTINVTGGGVPYVRNAGNNDTAVVNVSVPTEVNGLTEGSRGVMIGDGGAADGVEVLGGYADSTGKVAGSFSGATPQNVIIRARNAGIINAAVQHDEGGSDTDFTDEARDATGVDDVDLLPASPALDDAFYFGGIEQFEEVLINVTTAGATYVLTWEYWNGAWTALTVTDGTSSFQAAGWNTVAFSAPGDWATTSFAGLGPFYYVRARVTTGGGTQPQAEEITLNETKKYLPFSSAGTIASGTGLTTTAVWLEDTNNP